MERGDGARGDKPKLDEPENYKEDK